MTTALPTLDLAAPARAPSPLSRRIRALADMRGVWSLADQAILSLGNFLTSWLLLRGQMAWYGNYFTVISLIWFLNNLHMALVTYPISVTSAGISDSELRRRVRRAIGMTLLLLVPESAVITFGTVAVAGWRLVPWAILSLALWQLQETTRRALMARLEHRRAIIGDISNYIVQPAILFLLLHHGPLSIELAFAVIGITSGVAAIIQAIQLRLFVPSDTPPMHTMAHQARHHLSLGQWILMGNMITLLTVYSIPWVIRYYHGQTGVAMYSAVLLVLNASNPLLASVSNLITPVVAKVKTEANARGESGTRETRSAALKYALQGATLLFPFFAMLLLLPSVALHIFYKSGSPYLLLTTPMRVFTFSYSLMYVSAVTNAYLCGLGKSKLASFTQIANALATCLITLPLVIHYSVSGAAWGSLFPVAAQVTCSLFFAWRTSPSMPSGISDIKGSDPLMSASIGF